MNIVETLVFEKSTKNTHRYRSTDEQTPAVQVLYVSKTRTSDPPPRRIVLQIDEDEK